MRKPLKCCQESAHVAPTYKRTQRPQAPQAIDLVLARLHLFPALELSCLGSSSVLIRYLGAA